MAKTSREIAEDVNAKTGIDFTRYERPGLIAAFVTALSSVTSPLALIGNVMLAVLVSGTLSNLILFLICQQKRPYVWVMTVFFLVGNVGTVIVAICYGVIRSIRGAILASAKALAGAIDFANDVLDDLDSLGERGSDGQIVDIVRGTVCVSILPSVSRAIAKKMGFLSKPIVYGLDRFTVHLSNALPLLIPSDEDMNKDEDGDAEANEEAASAVKGLDREKCRVIIASLKERVEPFVRKQLLNKLCFPLFVTLVVSGTATVGALIAIYLLLM